MGKTEKICKNIFYRIFAVSFSWLMINVLFFNPFFDYKPYIVLPLAAVWFVFMALAFRLVEKYESFINQNTIKLQKQLFLQI